MSRKIEVEYKDGSSRELSFPEHLYDLGWSEYRPIERVIKLNASTDRDGEITDIDVSQDEFLVKIQEAIAEAVLGTNDITVDEVNVRTVKKIISVYGDDHESLNSKVKKKSSE